MRHVFRTARRRTQCDQLVTRPKSAVEEDGIRGRCGGDELRRARARSGDVRDALVGALVSDHEANVVARLGARLIEVQRGLARRGECPDLKAAGFATQQAERSLGCAEFERMKRDLALEAL